jgi:hypothetical protein
VGRSSQLSVSAMQRLNELSGRQLTCIERFEDAPMLGG